MSDDVNTILIDHLRQRAAFGAAKYGKVLRPFDGRNTLKDALEETLDTAVYLQKELMEREAIADLLERAAIALDWWQGKEFADEPEVLVSHDELRETAARLRQDAPRVGVPASAKKMDLVRCEKCSTWMPRGGDCPADETSLLHVPASAGPMERLEAMSGVHPFTCGRCRVELPERKPFCDDCRRLLTNAGGES